MMSFAAVVPESSLTNGGAATAATVEDVVAMSTAAVVSLAQDQPAAVARAAAAADASNRKGGHSRVRCLTQPSSEASCFGAVMGDDPSFQHGAVGGHPILTAHNNAPPPILYPPVPQQQAIPPFVTSSPTTVQDRRVFDAPSQHFLPVVHPFLAKPCGPPPLMAAAQQLPPPPPLHRSRLNQHRVTRSAPAQDLVGWTWEAAMNSNGDDGIVPDTVRSDSTIELKGEVGTDTELANEFDKIGVDWVDDNAGCNNCDSNDNNGHASDSPAAEEVGGEDTMTSMVLNTDVSSAGDMEIDANTGNALAA